MINMTREAIYTWLTTPDASELFAQAQKVRLQTKGNAVYLRGLIELSNQCYRDCFYCGMRRSNTKVHRYALTDAQILDCARLAQKLNFGTVVLQAGENCAVWTRERVASLIVQIKTETGQHVTLSLGERSEADTAVWREAGADRYLLRFETSDLKLFERIHPGAPNHGIHPRFRMLAELRKQGYEVGSGVMLGIPGQTLSSLIDDLFLFRDLRLDMIGLGPYLAHPDTPLGKSVELSEVPISVDFTCRCYALARLLCPSANIPSTTALSTLDPVHGRERGLTSGANVVMPNLTPDLCRADYQIYPNKICAVAPQADSMEALYSLLIQLGLQHLPA